MKREFTVILEGKEYPVLVEGDTVTVNGRPFSVEVADDGAVLVDGIAYDVALEGESATVGGESYPLQVSGLAVTPAPPVGSGPAPSPVAVGGVSDAEGTEGGGAVLAIMPGKIIRVMVEPGQHVEEGDPVCVLEAMKMENELHAHRSGVVRAVHVKMGDDVEKDQVLIEIE